MADRTAEMQAVVDKAREAGLDEKLTGAMLDEITRMTEAAEELDHKVLARLFASVNIAYQIADPVGWAMTMRAITGGARG